MLFHGIKNDFTIKPFVNIVIKGSHVSLFPNEKLTKYFKKVDFFFNGNDLGLFKIPIFQYGDWRLAMLPISRSLISRWRDAVLYDFC